MQEEWADWINSVGKVWVVAWTFLGVATVAFPYGTSLTSASTTPPIWLWIVEATLLGSFLIAVLFALFDTKFWRQHVRPLKHKNWYGTRLFLPYIAMIGTLCSGIGFYVQLVWYLNHSEIVTLADLNAAPGYEASGYTAACAVSIAMRVVTAVSFFILLFSDAGTRANADQVRKLKNKRNQP